MKKKFYSIVAMLMIMFTCVFASACGDKYKNFEFRVLYAFSQDSEIWYDGSDGISINYNQENLKGEGDESSLVFDENGVATLYVKIQVANVKKKHVDSITVSFASFVNLNFASKRVKQGEVFEVPIRGNVDTDLKLYENNSGKNSELPFVVSRELEDIGADLSVMPAMGVNIDSALNLNLLNNIKYYPEGLTNQLGVTYSVSAIGRYNAGGGFDYLLSSAEALNYVAIEDSILSIKNGNFYNASACVVKVKATSIFYNGENGEEEKSTLFDVYLVENNVGEPVLKFKGADDTISSQVNIYENGGVEYSTSTIVADTTGLKSEYRTPINTHNGNVAYGVSVYVLNSNNVYEKYVFGANYTNRIFYKFYRILAKLLPHSIVMKLAGT